MTADLSEFLHHRRRLAVDLRLARERAGLRVHQLAEQLGVSPSKISKIENSRVSVSIPDVRAWASATGVADEQLDRLLDRAEAARTEFVSRRSVREHGGFNLKQRQFGELERTAGTIRNFQPMYPPGLLQTPAITRQILAASLRKRADDEIATIVAAKVDRQTVLYDQGKRFEFVVAEAALRWRFGPPEVMLALLDRVATVATLSNVSVGLVPWTADAPVWHNHGFVIFDDRQDDDEPIVSVELLDGEHLVTDPKDVADYSAAFTQLREVGVYGSDAQALLRAMMDDLRQ